MNELIMLFFRITVFKQGPQDVPASWVVVRLVFASYVLINFLTAMLNGATAIALSQIAVELAMMASFTWPLLYFANKRARFPQTFTALLGTDAVINFVAIPAIATINSMPNELAYLLMLAMMLWRWLIIGHILRLALDRSWFFGLGVALLYITVWLQLMAALFPVIVGPTE